jgi:hypothetical protein
MTSNVDESPEEGLYRKRSQYLATLVRLAAPENLAEAEKIVAWINDIDQMIQDNARRKNDLGYGRYGEAFKAIQEYLTAKGAPATRTEIINALISGGWQPDRPASKNREALQKSFGKWLKGDRSKPPKFRLYGEKIGLIEWPE